MSLSLILNGCMNWLLTSTILARKESWQLKELDWSKADYVGIKNSIFPSTWFCFCVQYWAVFVPPQHLYSSNEEEVLVIKHVVVVVVVVVVFAVVVAEQIFIKTSLQFTGFLEAN
ncbi:hypothetical protein ElyMa_003207300 [Elysia marginata]|uniref:Uncharacterized protein n=1 Tax=Elysia marginata TaxID=1093978 RepID=A0AAV4J1I2_9GAST|nr:hypothetical protein ElyMa_003207300 [Elysia marginata]